MDNGIIEMDNATKVVIGPLFEWGRNLENRRNRGGQILNFEKSGQILKGKRKKRK